MLEYQSCWGWSGLASGTTSVLGSSSDAWVWGCPLTYWSATSKQSREWAYTLQKEVF